MEGKEVRFGIANSALWATATTAASNGSVNSMHDSFTPLGGLVPLTNIMNVSATTMVNPPRIELRLAERGRLGDQIAFSPVKNATLNPFARNAIADDLMVRVDRARANRKR